MTPLSSQSNNPIYPNSQSLPEKIGKNQKKVKIPEVFNQLQTSQSTKLPSIKNLTQSKSDSTGLVNKIKQKFDQLNKNSDSPAKMPIPNQEAIRTGIVNETRLKYENKVPLNTTSTQPTKSEAIKKVEVSEQTNSNEVVILEGKVEVISQGKVAVYPEIDSCICITVKLKDGSMVGAHLVQVPNQQQIQKEDIIPKMKQHIKDNSIEEVVLLGDLRGWTSQELGDERFGSGGNGVALLLAKAFDTEKVTYGEARSHKIIVPGKEPPKLELQDLSLTPIQMTPAFNDLFTFEDFQNYFT